MNFVSCLLSLALLASFLPRDNALKCYEKICGSKTSTDPNEPSEAYCSSKKEVTCKPGFDRCSNTRIKVIYPGFVVEEDVKNCSMAVMCNPTFCEKNNNTGGLVECKIDCCEGDLCNNGGPIIRPTAHTGPSLGPSGSDLTCYSCKSANFNQPDAKFTNATCDNPVKQTCGGGVVPGTKQDQCLRMKLKKGDMEYEMRNCSSGYAYCDVARACAMMNRTGEIAECNIKCCHGNLCNVEQQPMSPSSPSSPRGAASALLTGLLPYLLMMLVTVIVLQADIM